MKKLLPFAVLVIASVSLTMAINSRHSSDLYESAHRAGYRYGYHQCNLFWARTLLEKKIIDSQSYTNLILQSTSALERQ